MSDSHKLAAATKLQAFCLFFALATTKHGLLLRTVVVLCCCFKMRCDVLPKFVWRYILAWVAKRVSDAEGGVSQCGE